MDGKQKTPRLRWGSPECFDRAITLNARNARFQLGCRWRAYDGMRAAHNTPDVANCPICDGHRWVCSAHPLKPWVEGKGCCGEPAIPCRCNPDEQLPPESLSESTTSLL